MGLNDVWQDIGREIHVFTDQSFEEVPIEPGIYAWFYPLRIQTYDLAEFIREINSVQCFDASVPGKPKHASFADFAWDRVHIQIEKQAKEINLPSHIQSMWKKCTEDDVAWEQFRKSVMKASIFVPPLYVGKAKNLNTRCAQHVRGTKDGNDFHSRYEEFARSIDIKAKLVQDLIFACILTKDDRGLGDQDQEGDAAKKSYEEVVEEIVKYACRPVYSVK
jgi:hypothetical protein